jgi:hypothetical protein
LDNAAELAERGLLKGYRVERKVFMKKVVDRRSRPH